MQNNMNSALCLMYNNYDIRCRQSCINNWTMACIEYCNI